MPQSNERKAFFRSLPAYKTAGVEFLDRMATMAKAVSFPSGCTVVAEGSDVNMVYFCVEGHLKLSKKDMVGGEKILDVCGRGFTFGAEEVATRIPHQNTVAAVSDCELLAVSTPNFLNAADKQLLAV